MSLQRTGAIVDLQGLTTGVPLETIALCECLSWFTLPGTRVLRSESATLAELGTLHAVVE